MWTVSANSRKRPHHRPVSVKQHVSYCQHVSEIQGTQILCEDGTKAILQPLYGTLYPLFVRAIVSITGHHHVYTHTMCKHITVAHAKRNTLSSHGSAIHRIDGGWHLCRKTPVIIHCLKGEYTLFNTNAANVPFSWRLHWPEASGRLPGRTLRRRWPSRSACSWHESLVKTLPPIHRRMRSRA